MFGPAKADSLSPKLAGCFSIPGNIRISPYRQLPNPIRPFHKLTEVTGQSRLNRRNFAQKNLTQRPVQRNPVAFLYNYFTDLKKLSFFVDFNLFTTGNTTFTHTSGNNGCVGSHSSAGSQNSFGNFHPMDIVRTGFHPDQNYFSFFALDKSLVRRKNNLTDRGARRSGKSFCQNFGFGFRINNRMQ